MGWISSRIASGLMASNMKALGIRRTRTVALSYNRFRLREFDQHRQRLYRERFNELLADNGPAIGSDNVMDNGWALDTSRTLPGIDELIAEAEEIIAERGLKATKKPDTYRAFFQNIARPEDGEKYPAILDFALSSAVLKTVCRYMQTIPVLSGTLPPGIRLRSEEHTSELQSQSNLVCRLLLEKKNRSLAWFAHGFSHYSEAISLRQGCQAMSFRLPERPQQCRPHFIRLRIRYRLLAHDLAHSC